jgi:hypothetical protein
VKSPDFPLVLMLLEGQTAPGLPFLRRLHWIITPDPASEKEVARLFDGAAGTSSGSRPGELWRYVLAALKRQAWPANAGAPASWPPAFHGSRQWCFLTLKPGTEPLRALVEPFLQTWQHDGTDSRASSSPGEAVSKPRDWPGRARQHARRTVRCSWACRW